MKNENYKVSVPGRICLFGEHQDYMGLPIIAASVDLRLSISAKETNNGYIDFDLPDMNSRDFYPIKDLKYSNKRDYIKSCFNVFCKKYNYKFKGIKGVVESTIPINGGASSSSALCNALITTFALISKKTELIENKEEIAKLAFKSEVEEFNESGGSMDHYLTALGGVKYIRFGDKIFIDDIEIPKGKFVLADSLEPKNTVATIKRIRTAQEEALRLLKNILYYEKISDLSIEEALSLENKLPTELRPYLNGVLSNYQITKEVYNKSKKACLNQESFANAMNRLQKILENKLKISTPKLSKMIEISLKEGAKSAKINGSGEGGTIFAYTPQNTERVVEALLSLDCKVHVLEIGGEGIIAQKV